MRKGIDVNQHQYQKNRYFARRELFLNKLKVAAEKKAVIY